MKIGLVCPYNIARGGGVQEIVFATQAELRRRGHKVIIITPQPRSLGEDYEASRDVIFIGNATDFNSPLHTTIQVSASVSAKIAAVLAREKFDILHFHEPWVPFLSRQILSCSESINIATFHATLPNTAMSKTFIRAVTPYTRSLLKYIDEYTSVSNSAAEYVRSMSGEPVTIIPAGIDLKRFAPPERRAKDRDHKTIFYVGRLENRKGLKYLLRAFHILQATRPELSLVIAGDGPDRVKLENLAAELELTTVSFVGYISDEEKIRYLHEADLFCAPALYGESFGVVLLEAMATGLVTVAGNNPGYASVMRGLGAVSLVNPKDTDEFARRLDLLLHEEALRSLWQKWAKQEVGQYAYKHVVDQYMTVYKAALAKRAKPKKRLLPSGAESTEG